MIPRNMTGMTRFFLGLGSGVVLTVSSFGFVGVGHGTSAPLFFTMPLIEFFRNSALAPTLLLGPLLWALYFLFIPRIRKTLVRVITGVAILSAHVLAGSWVAIEDPAFIRALAEEQKGLAMFGLFFVLTVTCLFYFAVVGVKRIP